MITTVTWNNFLTTVAAATMLYYSITILLLFNSEISSTVRRLFYFFKNQTSPGIERDVQDSLMGQIKGEERIVQLPYVERVSAEGVEIQNSPDISNRLIELQSDIDVITQVTIRNKTDKSEFLDMLQTLCTRYPEIQSTTEREFVNNYVVEILNDCPHFNVQHEELEMCWPRNENLKTN